VALGAGRPPKVNDTEIYCQLFRAEFRSSEKKQLSEISGDKYVNSYRVAYRVSGRGRGRRGVQPVTYFTECNICKPFLT
jgi:hypothetical protein